MQYFLPNNTCAVYKVYTVYMEVFWGRHFQERRIINSAYMINVYLFDVFDKQKPPYIKTFTRY